MALLVGLALVAGGVVAPPARAATGLEGFDPGHLISDQAFFNAAAMSRDEIAAFIADKGNACVPGPDGTPCLKDVRVAIPERSATRYCGGAIPAQTDASAADVIAAASAACGVNPQVLLAVLQKEQALVTGSGERLYAARYAKATGLGCPDYQQCDPNLAGLFGQVYGTAERFRIYEQHPERYRHKVGVSTKVAYSPEPLCGTADIVIRNQATAGLYNYTPYVSNAAVLASPSSPGDLCSSGDKRNFYWYMKSWFPSSIPASAAPPVVPRPPSTLTPQMVDIYARADALGGAVLGAPTTPITCRDGNCTKQYAKATLTWTATDGVQMAGKFERVFGADRYATAAAVSRRANPDGARMVVVTTGTQFADALAAGPWAQSVAAPILLTTPGRVPPETSKELARLTPREVVLVGGTASISEAVERTIAATVKGATVRRIAGADRHGTALELADGFATASDVFVANGANYPDALVSGPLAAGRGPLLLVRGDGSIPAGMPDQLTRLGTTRITVLGGAGAIPQGTATALAPWGEVTRLGGTDRYDTAARAARSRFPQGSSTIYLASGENYPDALVAIGLQREPGPLLLSRGTCLPQPTHAYLAANPGAKVVVVGGPATLARSVAELTAC